VTRSLHLLTPPVVEPVTLAEALTQCHADAGVEDAWFAERISAGRRLAEGHIRRSLITQTWVLRYDGGSPAVIDLPRSPVQEVTSITIDGADIDVEGITINTEGCPARVILPTAATGTLRITYVAGYGDDGAAVPAPIKDAILLYVSHSYGNREGERDLPKAFYSLINPYRLFL